MGGGVVKGQQKNTHFCNMHVSTPHGYLFCFFNDIIIIIFYLFLFIYVPGRPLYWKK